MSTFMSANEKFMGNKVCESGAEISHFSLCFLLMIIGWETSHVTYCCFSDTNEKNENYASSPETIKDCNIVEQEGKYSDLVSSRLRSVIPVKFSLELKYARQVVQVR